MSDPTPLPDLNVLFAAHVATHVHHKIALQWIRESETFATCATTEQGLVRLLSNPAANPGASVADALEALRRLRARHGHVQWPDPTSLAEPLIDVGRARGHRQVTDFHLLNLAASFGGVVVTLDAKILRALVPADRRYVQTLAV